MPKHKLPTAERVRAQVDDLPDLPSVIRYIDPYKEVYCSIPAPAANDCWPLEVNGTKRPLDLSCFPPSVRELLRRTLAWCLQRYAPNSVAETYRNLLWLATRLGEEAIFAPFDLEALELKRFWHTKILPALIEDGERSVGLKRYLFFLCDASLGYLSPGYRDFVSVFRGPKQDPYASIRSADTFLTELEELALANYLDDLSVQSRASALELGVLRDACILIAAFQHAMRPIQIAKVKTSEVLIRLPNEATADGPIVHVRFHREKQADGRDKVALLRRIRREWAALYTQYAALRAANPSALVERDAVDQSFFGLTPNSVGIAIKRLTASILSHHRTATALRHTAAQRMADAGASHEEVAELLGQNNTRTSILYYRESATQAERANKALVTSPIYSAIATVHKTRTIDPATLRNLPQEHQIGAVPHGIPIAGIGKCDVGQSLCAKNPVLSCYGCRKFLPVRDVRVHEEVCGTLRPVVTQFFQASHGEAQSPAYTQLRRTIAAVEQVISDIKGEAERGPEQEL